MSRSVYIALIHFPIVDKHNHLVSTSVTNLDLHDISRSARTYGLEKFYIVTPVESQHYILSRICEHWETGWGSTYNLNRKDALGLTKVMPDVLRVHEDIRNSCGVEPIWVGTSAKRHQRSVSYPDMRATLESDGPPVCLVFGTGYGLHPELLLELDFLLEPISGPTAFNHLSVRAAAAIILDRLLGR